MLPLPMSTADVLTGAIWPALLQLPARMRTDEARLLMVAIALQESGLAHRQQVGGPAHGLWQFEKGGGVRGVLKYHSSASYARTLCEAAGVPATEAAVYWTLCENDELAAGFARLLLWTDTLSLPAIGDEQGAWDCYVRNWRPGKPDRDRWVASYAKAMKAVPE